MPFDAPESPFVIGILGDDPFGAVLDAAVQDETVNGRKFVVARYQNVEDMKTCPHPFHQPVGNAVGWTKS